MRFSPLLAGLPLVCALSPITRKGAYLYDASGARFFLKGVAYSANYGSSETPVDPGSISRLDPLANGPGCTRDVEYFKQLGVNVVRVYQVNATLDHSSCMSTLSSAGIYVLLDLASPAPNAAINTASPSWNTGLFTSFASTIAAFGSFDNVLGFNVGNEVINNLVDDQAAPFIKAAVRDVKAYLNHRGYTQLVGYAATDSPNSRVTLPDYLACNTTEGVDQLDYWGLNIYEWCGTSSFDTSGYKARTAELQGLGVPAFFSEYGCNAVEPRTFDDVPVLYSSDMSGVWSGGVIYEYQMESNHFGLVTISADGKSVSTTADFDHLQHRYTTLSPSASTTSSSPSTPSCPAPDPSTWPASTSLPPPPNADVCACVQASLPCVSTYDGTTDLGVIGTAIGTVCGTSASACAEISANGTTGTYGVLSGCDPLTQLNAALSSYYASQNKAPSACEFGGWARLAPSPSGDEAKACEAKANGEAVPGKLEGSLSAKPEVSGAAAGAKASDAAGEAGRKSASAKGAAVGMGMLGVLGAVSAAVALL